MSPDSGRHDNMRDSHTFRYSLAQDDQPMLAIVNAVSWVKGADASELSPLSRVIGADALARLFRHSGGDFYRSTARQEPSEIQVSFRYEGCDVTVTPTEIHIRVGSRTPGE